MHRRAEIDNHSSCWVSKSKKKESVPSRVARGSHVSSQTSFSSLSLALLQIWLKRHWGKEPRINYGDIIDQKSGCNILLSGCQRAGGKSCQRPGIDGHLHTFAAEPAKCWRNLSVWGCPLVTLVVSICAKWDAFSFWAEIASSLSVRLLAATNWPWGRSFSAFKDHQRYSTRWVAFGKPAGHSHLMLDFA